MKALENLQPISQGRISVDVLLDSPAKLTHLNSPVGLDNEIVDMNIYRPQLALTGYVKLFNFKRVQVFGNTEAFYLKSLTKQQQINAFETLCGFDMPCIILTNGHKLCDELTQIATNRNIAIFNTEYNTTKTTYLLTEYFDDQFAQQVVVHGSYVDVYGVGILFTGRSGIGKSEIALDLIERGHRLVADDVVMLTKKKGTIIIGTGTSLVQHFMEIRGLGMIDVRQMFGIRSIRFQKRLEIIVELEEYANSDEYTRTGLDTKNSFILDTEVQAIKLPIFPGKNITVIAEVIALNYLLRTYGYDSAKVFSNKLTDAIRQKSGISNHGRQQRIISYFQGDTE